MMFNNMLRYMMLAGLCAPCLVSSFSINSVTRSSISPLRSAVAPQVATKSIFVERPDIHWTVPNFKVGWKDDEGNWVDEDGIRDGPPMNFWRQRIDQGEYTKDMNVVDALFDGEIESMKEQIAKLESRNGVRYPSVHRKILGEWAPLMRCGVPSFLGTTTNNSENSKIPIPGFGYDQTIEVPLKVSVARTDGRKFGTRNNYGLFDAQLVEGELVTVKTNNNSSSEEEEEESIDKTFPAFKNNEPFILGMVDEKPLFLGGITYITDYILIQRGPEGDIDLWLRCDDSYLGVSKEEEEIYMREQEE